MRVTEDREGLGLGVCPEPEGEVVGVWKGEAVEWVRLGVMDGDAGVAVAVDRVGEREVDPDAESDDAVPDSDTEGVPERGEREHEAVLEREPEELCVSVSVGVRDRPSVLVLGVAERGVRVLLALTLAEEVGLREGEWMLVELAV